VRSAVIQQLSVNLPEQKRRATVMLEMRTSDKKMFNIAAARPSQGRLSLSTFGDKCSKDNFGEEILLKV